MVPTGAGWYRRRVPRGTLSVNGRMADGNRPGGYPPRARATRVGPGVVSVTHSGQGSGIDVRGLRRFTAFSSCPETADRTAGPSPALQSHGTGRHDRGGALGGSHRQRGARTVL